MKRVFAALAACSLVISAAGCTKKEPEKTTCLQLMEQVNDKNVFHSDPLSRLWYQIYPSSFADGNGDSAGDLKGIQNYLSYLSDADDASTESDLNISGLLLMNLVKTDSAGAPSDYTTIDPTLGSLDDLQALCEQASMIHLPVMISLDLNTLSESSPAFLSVKDEAEKLPDGESVDDMTGEYVSLFTLSDEQWNSNWFRLGNSRLYYLGYRGTPVPNINQDSKVFKEMVRNAVNEYLNLGISGFYLQNINGFYSNSDEKNADFANWFDEMVHNLDEEAYVVSGAEPYRGEFEALTSPVADSAAAGAEGYLAKAATGTITARQLGDILQTAYDSNSQQAVFINNPDHTLDLLKTKKKSSALKMLLALQILSSGQVFITAGDELGLPKNQVDLVEQAIRVDNPNQESGDASKSDSTSESKKDQQAGDNAEEASLAFENMPEQREDGDSVLNFVLQAIRLRDSYAAISSGSFKLLEDQTTDDVLVFRKKTGSSEVVLAFNFSEAEQKVDTSGITLHGLPVELGGILLSDEGELTLENDELTLPAGSVAVLK